MAFDKIAALSAPPGHSLTDTPNKWQWEQPPEFSDPNDAVDFVLDGLEKPNTRKDITRMMAAGITIEELVNQIGLKGFMQGYYSPDVAELIKPSIAIYLMGVADDAGFTPAVSGEGESDGEPQGEVDDQTFFEILKDRNPEMFAAMMEQENEDQRLAEYIKMQSLEEESTPPIEASQSFLDVPDSVPIEVDMEESEVQ